MEKICDVCDKVGKIGYWYCKNCAGYLCKKCGKNGLCTKCAPKL